MHYLAWLVGLQYFNWSIPSQPMKILRIKQTAQDSGGTQVCLMLESVTCISEHPYSG
jgi:hypothetical protein